MFLCSRRRQDSYLETGRLAVAARVADRQISVVESPDRLATAELVVVVGGDQLMAPALKFVQRRRRKAWLATHLKAVRPAEPRAVTGRLRILAVVDDAPHHLHVTLRLHGSAHHPEAHHRSAVLGQETRDDGVVWPLTRPHLVRMPLLHSEIRAAVLQSDPGAGHHDA